MSKNTDISRHEGCAIGIIFLFFFVLIPAMTTTTVSFENTAVAAAPTMTPVPTNTALPPMLAPTEEIGPETSTGGYAAEVVAQGEQNFMLCAACHGPDARGIPNLGKNLVESEFVKSLNDTDLMNFIKTGRPVWDAANTTGIDMPPKGGNPALSDEQLISIIAYIRHLENS